MKPGSNSTRPLIFGIGTVECIVAVIKGSWSGLGLLSVRFNSRLTKKRTRERERDIETDRESSVLPFGSTNYGSRERKECRGVLS